LYARAIEKKAGVEMKVAVAAVEARKDVAAVTVAAPVVMENVVMEA
jgi:hypothetical protein